jgi:hypothetical protein
MKSKQNEQMPKKRAVTPNKADINTNKQPSILITLKVILFEDTFARFFTRYETL